MSTPAPIIAVVNAGSATLKLSVFERGECVLRVLIDRLSAAGDSTPRAKLESPSDGVLHDAAIAATNHEQALDWLFDWIARERPQWKIGAVGHRVVHGGDRVQAERVTPEVLATIEDLVPLAPLHQPHNLAPIRVLAARYPELPQVVCYDTAFHAGQSRLERMYALPREWYDRGVKHYGFHGTSYEYIAGQLLELSPRAAAGRSVVCHLGSGASLCAIQAGKSIATTMGFTALEGLPMGTRTGAIDPGVLLYLLGEAGLSLDELTRLVYRESGLLGISGISADMRDLLASDDPRAAEAVEYFCRKIAQYTASLAAAMGGLDALVFTGGIGEHAAPVRARVCELCAWLGVEIEAAANAASQTRLHTAESRIEVLVVPTNEELMIARHVAALTRDC